MRRYCGRCREWLLTNNQAKQKRREEELARRERQKKIIELKNKEPPQPAEVVTASGEKLTSERKFNDERIGEEYKFLMKVHLRL